MRNGSYEIVSSMPGGTNFILLLRDRKQSNMWVGKVFLDSQSYLEGHADLNHRAMLAYRLSREIGTCIPEKKLINFTEIDFSPEFDRILQKLGNSIIHDELLITRYEGISLGNFLKISFITDIRNLDEVIRNFVFNLWFGNYDKKIDDYVVNNDLICHSFDYSLSGPGFVPDNNLSIGAYFQTYDFSNTHDSGWAIADPLIEVVRTRRLGLSYFVPILERIDTISENTLRSVFEGLSFYRWGTAERIDDVCLDFLRQRQTGLREAVRRWCEEGYPKGKRIPEE